MKVWPAIVKVPVRDDPVKAAKLNVTVPFPVPLDPDVICSQLTFAVDVHAHPLGAVTLTGPPLPASLPTV